MGLHQVVSWAMRMFATWPSLVSSLHHVTICAQINVSPVQTAHCNAVIWINHALSLRLRQVSALPTLCGLLIRLGVTHSASGFLGRAVVARLSVPGARVLPGIVAGRRFICRSIADNQFSSLKCNDYYDPARLGLGTWLTCSSVVQSQF